MSPPKITGQSRKNGRTDLEMISGESSEFSDSETLDDSLKKSGQPEVIDGINTLDNVEREFYMKFAKHVLGYTCGNCMCCKEIKLMAKLFEINSIILGHRKSIESHDSGFAVDGPSTSSGQTVKESPASKSTIKPIDDDHEKESISHQNQNEAEELQILQANDEVFDQNDSKNLNKTSSASKKRAKKRKTIDIFKAKTKKKTNKYATEKEQNTSKQIEPASTSDNPSMDEVQNGTSETISKQQNLKQGKKRKSTTTYKRNVKKASNKSVVKRNAPEIDQSNDKEIEIPNKNVPTEVNEADNDHFNEILEELRQRRASKLLEEQENSKNIINAASDQEENISDTEDDGACGETFNMTLRKDSPISKYRQKLDFSSPNLKSPTTHHEETQKKRETLKEKKLTVNGYNSRDDGACGETFNMNLRKDSPIGKYRQTLVFSSPNLKSPTTHHEETQKKRETLKEKKLTVNGYNSRDDGACGETYNMTLRKDSPIGNRQKVVFSSPNLKSPTTHHEETQKKRETHKEKKLTVNGYNSRASLPDLKTRSQDTRWRRSSREHKSVPKYVEAPLPRKMNSKKTLQKRKPLYSPENWLNSKDFTKMSASA